MIFKKREQVYTFKEEEQNDNLEATEGGRYGATAQPLPGAVRKLVPQFFPSFGSGNGEDLIPPHQ
jgi:hypothetical protein